MVHDANGKVGAFIEKPPKGEELPIQINAGTYFLEREILDSFRPGARSIEHETFPQVIAAGKALYAYTTGDYWLNLGRPKQYLTAHRDILSGTMPLLVEFGITSKGREALQGHPVVHRSTLPPTSSSMPAPGSVPTSCSAWAAASTRAPSSANRCSGIASASVRARNRAGNPRQPGRRWSRRRRSGRAASSGTISPSPQERRSSRGLASARLASQGRPAEGQFGLCCIRPDDWCPPLEDTAQCFPLRPCSWALTRHVRTASRPSRKTSSMHATRLSASAARSLLLTKPAPRCGSTTRRSLPGSRAKPRELYIDGRLVSICPVDLVNIQHEYGLFGGERGEWLADFISMLDKPAVLTIHTVLPDPDETYMRMTKALYEEASKVVALFETGRNLLERVYRNDPDVLRSFITACPTCRFTTRPRPKPRSASGNGR